MGQQNQSRVTDAPTSPLSAPASGEPSAAVLSEDVLVEDVSIDGMCGVY